jgi:hypothetical protein
MYYKVVEDGLTYLVSMSRYSFSNFEKAEKVQLVDEEDIDLSEIDNFLLDSELTLNRLLNKGEKSE